MKILHLTLKKQWFDMIASGEKGEEYREIKPYWDKRLRKDYDQVVFRNGYAKDAPKITVAFKGTSIKYGFESWGAPLGRAVYAIALGEIISIENYP